MPDPDKDEIRTYSWEEFRENILPGFLESKACLLLFQDDKLLYVNDYFVKSLGFEGHDLHGIEKRMFDCDGSKEGLTGLIRDCPESEMRIGELNLKKGDGSEARFKAEISPFLIEGESYFGCMLVERAFIQDPLEFQLQEEELFRFIAEKSQNGIILLNQDLKMVYANPAAMEIYGHRSMEEMINTPTINTVAPESLQVVIERAKNWMEGRENEPRVIYKIVRKDGKLRDVEVLSGTFQIGTRRYLLYTIMDITDRLLTERALKESEERYRLHFDNVQDVIFSLDRDLRLVSISPSIEHVMGFRPEHVIGKSFSELEFLPPAEKGRAFFNSRRVFDGEVLNEIEYEFFTRDGSRVVGSVSARPYYEDSEVVQIFCVARNITERRLAEEARRESEERFKAIFETAQDCIFIKDRDLNYVQVNPALERLFEMSADEIIGHGDEVLFGDEVAPLVREVDLKVLEGEIVEEQVEKPVQGQPAFFHVIKVPMRSGDGRIIGLCGIARDVTEKMKSEERLRTLGAAVEQTTEGVVVTDPDGNVQYVNEAWARMHGYEPQELIGKRSFTFHNKEQIEEQLKPFIKAMMKTGHCSGEVGHVRKDKSAFPTWMSGAVIHDAEGKDIGLVGIARDITERKLAEQALKESEERYARLVEASPDAIGVTVDGKAVFGNNAVLKLLGADSHDEVNGKPIMDFVHPEDRKAVEDNIRRMMLNQPYSTLTERRLLLPDGMIIDVEIAAVPTVYQGRPAVQAIIRDISERKRAEQALRESEEKFLTFVQDSAYAYFEVDLMGNYTYANQTGEEMIGYTLEQDKGLNFRDVIVEEDLERAVRDLALVFTEPNAGPKEYRLKRKDGEVIDVEINTLPLKKNGKIVGFMGTAMDITFRKTADRAIRQSEIRFRTAAECVSDLVYEWDIETMRFKWFGDVERMFGYPPGEFPRDVDGWGQLLEPEDLERMRKAVERTLRTGEPYCQEYRIRKKSGRGYVDILSRGAALPDENGNLQKWIGSITDVTEQRRAERALKESENLYRLLTENSTDVIWSMDLTMKNTFISPSIERFLGYSIKEHLNRPIHEILTPQSLQTAIRAFNEVMELEKKGGTGGEERARVLELEYYHKDGHTVWAEANATLMRDEQGKAIGVQGVSRDITERKKAQEAIRQSEQRYANLLASCPEGIGIHADGKILFINQAGADIMGADSPEEVIGKQVRDYLHPEYREILARRLKEMAESGRAAAPIEEKFLRVDGSEVEVEVQAVPFDLDGRQAFQVVFRDVSEQKEALRRLQESEEKYHNLVENCPDAIAVAQDGTVVYINPAGVRMMGANDSEEIIGRPARDFIIPEHRDKVQERSGRLLNQGEKQVRFEEKFMRIDGTVFDGEAVLLPVDYNGKPAVQIVYNDVTARKRAEQALLRNVSRLYSLIENTTDIISIVGAEGIIKYASPSTSKILGYREDEFTNRKISDFVHPQDLPAVAEAIVQTLKEPGTVFHHQARFRHKDGSWRTLSGTGINMLDEPAVQGIITTSRDITGAAASEDQDEQNGRSAKSGNKRAGNALRLNGKKK